MQYFGRLNGYLGGQPYGKPIPVVDGLHQPSNGGAGESQVVDSHQQPAGPHVDAIIGMSGSLPSPPPMKLGQESVQAMTALPRWRNDETSTSRSGVARRRH
jgi:hypothetical protein